MLKCRICTNQIINKEDIIQINDEIRAQLEYCLKIKPIIAPHIPKHLCKLCSDSLQITFDFIKKCLKAEDFFTNYANSKHNYIYKHELEPKWELHNDIDNEFDNSEFEVQIDSIRDYEHEKSPKKLESNQGKQYETKRSKEPEPFSSYICHACKYQTDKCKLIASHISREHKDKYDMCPFCEKFFTHKYGLERHLINCHINLMAADNQSKCNDEIERIKVKQESTTPKELSKALPKETADIIEKPDEFKLHDDAEQLIKNENLSSDNEICIALEFPLKKKKKCEYVPKSQEKFENKCKKCGVRYKYKSSLENHIAKVHMKVPNFKTKIFICDFCKEKFKKKQLIRSHMKTHMEIKSYCCPMCSKCFSQNRSLRDHIRGHRNEKNFECICGKKFYSKQIMRLHAKAVHTDKRNYICDHCNKALKTKTSLKNHLKLHIIDEVVCDICGTTCHNMIALKQHHNRMHSERSGFCPECNTHQTYLAKHIKLKHRRQIFICDVCSKQFNRRHMFNVHMSEKHGAAPKVLSPKGRKRKEDLVCHLCGYKCKNIRRLEMHTRHWHSERAGFCLDCNKHQANLETHKFEAHADRPFSCEYCNKKFTRKPNLTIHLARTHKIGGRDYSCEYEGCDVVFRSSIKLNYHIKKYHLKMSPYKCIQCNKDYIRKTHLVKHYNSAHGNNISMDVITND